jgi:hypothetical protein
MATVEKSTVDKSTKLGKYATAEEAARTKNAPLIALLKKLDVKVVTKP